MAKGKSAFGLVLGQRPPGAAVTRWLYEELRRAILEGRLVKGARLPATRDLARQQGVSRGTVVAVFEQLISEGYLCSRIGAGTVVNDRLPEDYLQAPRSAARRAAIDPYSPLQQVLEPGPVRAFRPYEPALDAFPIEIWTRITTRRLRRASVSLLASGDPRGYRPLREAVAGYLGTSRGVNCIPDQIVIVSGAQQSLDLIARLLLSSGDPVWIEDPGFIGATMVFRQAGARVVSATVDEHGFNPFTVSTSSKHPKAVYLTPGHQFPLGMTMPLERRLAVLEWARQANAYLIEDDYDSEFRYEQKPVPAMQGLDQADRVIFMGSFNKVLFTSLRLAYLVLPAPLLERFLTLRFLTDRFAPTLNQAILCDFLVEGHFGRHLRRMREIYSERLQVLREHIDRHLKGALQLPRIEAGLQIAAHLEKGLNALQLETAAAKRQVEVMAINRFLIERTDVNAVLLGFASIRPQEIRTGVEELAQAVS